MRMILMSLVGSVLLAGAAMAMDDPFANYYDNTVAITGGGGEDHVIHINKDGTYESIAPNGTIKGVWKLKEADACFTQTDPAADTYCVPATSHEVGESWELHLADGVVETATLQAGR
ncbi:MAG: hypothetical protein GC184_05905 [Rhizobiales bacterium]|nr:hypothetical protein [Hyphomicrobiales bacterium]